MAYEDSEVSVHDAKPNELFKFEGTYQDYFYTSGPELVTFGGDDYIPLAIKRTEVRTGTQEDDGLDINVEMPVSAQLVKTYGFSVSPPRLHLTIYRYHRGAIGDYVAYWTGPVNNIKTTGGRATLRSPSTLAHALVGAMPNVYFQTPCNHVLFDARCEMAEEDWTEAATVTDVDGKLVTVNSVGALDGVLVGGEMRLASGERRMIISQIGTAIMVNFPFHNMVATDIVQITAGCDHAYLGDCATRFDNQLNFGGFPFIPPENVFESGMEPGTVCVDNTCLPFVPVFSGVYWEVMIEYPFEGSVSAMANALLSVPYDHEPPNITYTNTEESPSLEGWHEYLSPWGHKFRYTAGMIEEGESFRIDMQFPAFSVSGPAWARLSFKRWFEENWTILTPFQGATIHANGHDFDIEGLWPRAYDFYAPPYGD